MNSTAPCPSSAKIVDLVAGRLPPEEAGAIADHAASCPSCFRGIGVAGAVAAVGAESAPAVAPTPTRRAWIPYAAAAAVALLVFAGGALFSGREEGVPVGGDARGGEGGIAILEPAPGAVLAAPPERLVWRGEGESARWRVRLLASATEEIWRAETKEPSIAVPAEVRSRLAAGGRFLLEVGRLGAPAAGSPAGMAFEIRPPR